MGDAHMKIGIRHERDTDRSVHKVRVCAASLVMPRMLNPPPRNQRPESRSRCVEDCGVNGPIVEARRLKEGFCCIKTREDTKLRLFLARGDQPAVPFCTVRER